MRRKFFRTLTDYRWYLLATAGLVAFALGYIGFTRLYSEQLHQSYQWTDPMFGSLKLFLFNAPDKTQLPWQLDVARFLAPLTAGYAGVIALGLLFRDRVQQMRIPLMRNHVVVCGLGYVGRIFLLQLRDAGFRAVVIEMDATNPRIELCRSMGIPVIIGDAQSQRTLQAAGVGRASRLLAVSDYDAINAEIVSLARELVAGRARGPLRCLARIGDRDLCSMLRLQQSDRATDTVSLDFFNTDEVGARLLLDQFPAITEHGNPHILVAHLDELGRWLVWHAAHDWYYTRQGGDSTRLRVTVADDDAPQRITSLIRQSPEVEPLCEFVPITTSVGDIRQMVAAQGGGCRVPPFTRAYVTAYRDEVAVPAALMLRNELDESIPVTLALSRTHGVTRLITDAENDHGPRIDVFATLDRACTIELIRGGSYEPMARAIHRLWRVEQLRVGKPAETWDELDESRKNSSRKQALDIINKLHSIDCDVAPMRDWDADFEFTATELEDLSIAEHDRWWKERLDDGWTLGDTKDIEHKKHPDLIPWKDLAEDVREFDRVFIRGMPASLASVGLQIVRRG